MPDPKVDPTNGNKGFSVSDILGITVVIGIILFVLPISLVLASAMTTPVLRVGASSLVAAISPDDFQKGVAPFWALGTSEAARDRLVADIGIQIAKKECQPGTKWVNPAGAEVDGQVQITNPIKCLDFLYTSFKGGKWIKGEGK